MRPMFAAILALPLLAVGPQSAVAGDGTISLGLPVDCAIGERCVVQFHVDRRAGPEIGDYRCGRLSYDGHRGTDFRVLSADDFDSGIAVLAAAAGTVVATRDGMADIDVGVLGRANVENRAGGNLVILAHQGGWETHYLHLRKGSLAVARGDVVAAGARLGVIGLSGDTNFPHLHFEVRRARHAIVDPFDVLPVSPACDRATQPLWTAEALAQLAYRPVLGRVGFAPRMIDRRHATYESTPRALSAAEVPALFFWAEIYGLARGDTISVQWRLADGGWKRPATKVWQSDLPYDFTIGRLVEPPPLPAGTYAVRLRVERKGATGPLLDTVDSIGLE